MFSGKLRKGALYISPVVAEKSENLSRRVPNKFVPGGLQDRMPLSLFKHKVDSAE
jgi:hypothetical protein